jgi:hypothetical protein
MLAAVMMRAVRLFVRRRHVRARGGRGARVYLYIRHTAPGRVLHAARIPIDGSHRRIVDPDPAAVAKNIGVVMPAVRCATRVHDVSH